MSKDNKATVAVEAPNKKELSKVVLDRLTGSLTEFQLTDKKLESRLTKVSRRLASDIIKQIKKENAKAAKANKRKQEVHNEAEMVA